MPNKHEWKNGSIEVPIYTGENCGENCWEQTAPRSYETKYWGGYYLINENISWEINEYLPSNYDPDSIGVFENYNYS